MYAFSDPNEGDHVDGLTYADYTLQNCSVLFIVLDMPQDLTSTLSARVCLT